MTIQQARNLIARHIMATRRYCSLNAYDFGVQYVRTTSYVNGVMDAYLETAPRWLYAEFSHMRDQIDSVIDGLKCYNRS